MTILATSTDAQDFRRLRNSKSHSQYIKVNTSWDAKQCVIDSLDIHSIVYQTMTSTNEVAHIEELEWIKYRKRGNRSLGVLLGTLGGGVIGLVIASNQPPPDTGWDFPEIRKINGFITGGIVGALCGGIIASIRKTIPINGSQKEYEMRKAELEMILR